MHNAPPARLSPISILVLSLALTACTPPPEQIADAIGAVNRAFQADYESMLSTDGVRVYRVRRGDAFVALHAAFARIGMQITNSDPDVGTLTAAAAAPLPLSAQEWHQAGQADLPRMREIARVHVGPMAEFISFEPEGLEVVINAALLDSPGGVEVSLTARMREVAPPRSNMPRREYPPPTAARLALGKLWQGYERELRQAGKIP